MGWWEGQAGIQFVLWPNLNGNAPRQTHIRSVTSYCRCGGVIALPQEARSQEKQGFNTNMPN